MKLHAPRGLLFTLLLVAVFAFTVTAAERPPNPLDIQAPTLSAAPLLSPLATSAKDCLVGRFYLFGWKVVEKKPVERVFAAHAPFPACPKCTGPLGPGCWYYCTDAGGSYCADYAGCG